MSDTPVLTIGPASIDARRSALLNKADQRKLLRYLYADGTSGTWAIIRNGDIAVLTGAQVDDLLGSLGIALEVRP